MSVLKFNGLLLLALFCLSWFPLPSSLGRGRVGSRAAAQLDGLR